MSEDDRAAKAARAKALLAKRQKAKKAGPAGIISPPSRSTTPALSEPPGEEEKRDVADLFGGGDGSDSSWITSMPRAPSPAPGRVGSPASATHSPRSSAVLSPSLSHEKEMALQRHMSTLQAEKDTLSFQLQQFDGIDAQLKQAEAALMQERQSGQALKEQLQHLQVERDGAFRTLQEVRTALDTERTRAHDLEKEARALRSDKDTLSQIAERTKAQYDARLVDERKQRESAEERLKHAQGEQGKSARAYQQASTHLDEERARARTLENKNQRLEAEINDMKQNNQQTINLLVSEKSSLTAELERLESIEAASHELEQDLQQERSKSVSLAEEVQTVDVRIREITSTLNASQTAEKELADKCRDQERQLQLAQASVAELTKESNQHKRRVRELEEQIQADDRAERLEESLRNSQNRADELEFQLTKLKQTHATLKAERDDLNSKVSAAQAAESEWKSKHDVLQEQFEDARRQMEENVSKSSSLAQEKTTLQMELASMQRAIVELQERLTQAATELTASARQLQAAQTEARNANRRAEEAEKMQQDLQAEGTSLMRSLDEMRPKLVELMGAKLELADKIDSLERAVHTKEDTISQLEAALEDVRAEHTQAARQLADTTSMREKDALSTQEMNTELQRGYAQLQNELDAALESIQSLEAERSANHQEASRRLADMSHLSQSSQELLDELETLRAELEERRNVQEEEHDIFARAQNELEALRIEVSAKDEELERLRDSLISPSQANAPNSFGNEVLESARQLDLSAAHQRIRSLEDAVYASDARAHNLQRHVAMLEQQLAGRTAVVQRAISPPTGRASFGSSRGPAPALSVSPLDEGLSEETRHKRHVSLSMLKARMDSERAAAAVHGGSRPGTPLQAARRAHRPQFLDENHIFWCSACKGDLVIL